MALQTTDDTRDLLEQLDAIRERQGITKVELAERMGVQVESLRATLNNRGGEPALSRVRAIAEALGCKVTFNIEKIE